jgi:hypothetical protein
VEATDSSKTFVPIYWITPHPCSESGFFQNICTYLLITPHPCSERGFFQNICTYLLNYTTSLFRKRILPKHLYLSTELHHINVQKADSTKTFVPIYWITPPPCSESIDVLFTIVLLKVTRRFYFCSKVCKLSTNKESNSYCCLSIKDSHYAVLLWSYEGQSNVLRQPEYFVRT